MRTLGATLSSRVTQPDCEGVLRASGLRDFMSASDVTEARQTFVVVRAGLMFDSAPGLPQPLAQEDAPIVRVLPLFRAHEAIAATLVERDEVSCALCRIDAELCRA